MRSILETPIRPVETAGVINSKITQYMMNLGGYMQPPVSLNKGKARVLGMEKKLQI